MKKRKDGRYVLTRQVDGQRIYFYGKSERECYKQYENFLANKNAPRSYGYYAEIWAGEHRETVGINTWESYKPRLEWLKELYKKPIDTVTCRDVQKIIDKKAAQGYSKSTLKKLRCVNSMILDTAIRDGTGIFNFSQALIIPRSAPKTARKMLNAQEIEKITEAADKEFGLYAYFLLWTGMRRGEALALQWKDIDTKKHTVSVTKAVEFVVNEPQIKLPKTDSGVRILPLPECLENRLKPLKKQNIESDYVFGGEKPLTKTMIRRRWNKYCMANGLNITQHQLRHTYATMLKDLNVSPKDAQQMLGHADYRTTMDIYTHFSDSAVDNVRRALERRE